MNDMKRIFLSLLIVLLLVSSVFAASKEQAPKAGFVVKNGQWQRQSEGNDVGDPIEFVPRNEY
jgi:predicted S18 family serine protease